MKRQDLADVTFSVDAVCKRADLEESVGNTLTAAMLRRLAARVGELASALNVADGALVSAKQALLQARNELIISKQAFTRTEAEANKFAITIHDIHAENMALREALQNGSRVVLKSLDFEKGSLKAKLGRLEAERQVLVGERDTWKIIAEKAEAALKLVGEESLHHNGRLITANEALEARVKELEAKEKT